MARNRYIWAEGINHSISISALRVRGMLKGGDGKGIFQDAGRRYGSFNQQINPKFSKEEGIIVTKISKIIALTALITLAFGMTAIDNAVADEARNEVIIERNVEEIWHKVNVAVADEIVATNYVRHLPGGKEIHGREAYKQYVTKFMTTFPDTRWDMDIMISKGDYVVVRYSGSGTHTGEGMGTPTGKKWEITANIIYRLAGGKLVEDWSEWDKLVLMQQLGFMPQKQ